MPARRPARRCSHASVPLHSECLNIVDLPVRVVVVLRSPDHLRAVAGAARLIVHQGIARPRAADVDVDDDVLRVEELGGVASARWVRGGRRRP
jgi:hypothetical protein